LKTLGKNPTSPERLRRLEQSPHFKDGIFHNINTTPMSKPGGSTLKTAVDFFLTPKPFDIRPATKIPGIKINLNDLPDETPSLVWFGHSSYLIKFQGQTFLIDPVFSGHASPIASAVKAFEGTDLYSVEDLPNIDVLILTHDHYDHIDFETIDKLKNKVGQVICTLGVGEHLQYWGFSPNSFSELDWWEEKTISALIKITATPARHFSGRGLTRFKTLWASYVLQLGRLQIFIGGDSGYDDQFRKIGDKFKFFDLALLECGQYGLNWPYIHMFPEQTAQAAVDLNAKVLMPVHWGKFILSTHSWTEPIERVQLAAEKLQLKTTTPQIGEVLQLGKKLPDSKWWRSVN
jgi:L-ascorbate metabolism protein UlaG (beta-lactamase superfamily)